MVWKKPPQPCIFNLNVFNFRLWRTARKIKKKKKITAKEGTVHVSASCSSLENKKAAVWKWRQKYSELKGTAHGKPAANPIASAPWRKKDSTPVTLFQASGKMNFPGDEKPCCEFILCLCF